MEKGFIDLAIKIVDEEGKDILKESRSLKGLFLDYSRGQYKNEINLLIKTIELDFYNKIINSNDLSITKLILSRQLNENLFIIDEIADSIVTLLIGLLRNRNYLKYLEENNIKQFLRQELMPTNNIQENEIDDDIFDLEIITGNWICNFCGKENSENSISCKYCGAVNL
jgi:hypothetical protein